MSEEHHEALDCLKRTAELMDHMIYADPVYKTVSIMQHGERMLSMLAEMIRRHEMDHAQGRATVLGSSKAVALEHKPTNLLLLTARRRFP